MIWSYLVPPNRRKIISKFEWKDLEEGDIIFNMKVTWTVEGGLFLSQSPYFKDVLEKYKELNGAVTPMEGATKLRSKQKEVKTETWAV